MESVNQFAKMALWKSVQEKILYHYWSAHDHCGCCCLQRKSVKLHKFVAKALNYTNVKLH